MAFAQLHLVCRVHSALIARLGKTDSIGGFCFTLEQGAARMTGMNWEEFTPEERLLAEQAVLNVRELNKTGHEAADGTVLRVCEKLAIKQGRELTSQMLEASLQEQAEAVENKGRRVGRAVEGTGVTGDVKPDDC